jgi:probable HAF family extracellular repeat protein
MSCRLVLIRVLAGYDIIDGGAAQGDTESGFNATFNYPGYLQAGGYSGTNRTPYLYEQSGVGTFQIDINQTLGINTLGEVFALDDAQPSYAAGTAVIDHNTWNSPVIWTKNGLIVLPGRGGAQAINNARHVAGWSRDAAGNSLAHLWKNHYQPGTVLGTLGGPSSAAFGINALDQVVGSADQVDGKSHAFSWTSTGGMVDIHPGGDNSEARSVNDKGAIVGWTQAAPGNPANRSAFVKPNGQTASLLPHLPGNQVSEALAVNNAGLVVGFSGQEAAIWSGGEVARLVDQVFNASGWILSKANDIGEGGAIVGRAGRSSAARR